MFLGDQFWSTSPRLGISSNAYGSVFYLITGFHALHVVAGLLLMLPIAITIGAGSRAPTPAVEAVSVLLALRRRRLGRPLHCRSSCCDERRPSGRRAAGRRVLLVAVRARRRHCSPSVLPGAAPRASVAGQRPTRPTWSAATSCSKSGARAATAPTAAAPRTGRRLAAWARPPPTSCCPPAACRSPHPARSRPQAAGLHDEPRSTPSSRTSRRSGDGPPIPDVDPDAGTSARAELFSANCAPCHNAAGAGGALSYGRRRAVAPGGSTPSRSARPCGPAPVRCPCSGPTRSPTSR